jgi:hypothetical protein
MLPHLSQHMPGRGTPVSVEYELAFKNGEAGDVLVDNTIQPPHPNKSCHNRTSALLL